MQSLGRNVWVMRNHQSFLRWAPFALLLAVTACSSKRGAAARAAVPVGVAVARRAAVPYTIAANGLVTPVQVATVAPQVDGIVTRVAFREGQSVARGQVLFEIEPRPYLAAYQQALGALARDAAQLESAQLDAARYADLVKQDYVTKEDYETKRATAAALAATVRSDSGLAATAQFNLDNTTIRAPIGGRTGGLLVREGNLVHAAGMTPLVVINQIEPILVRFAVPGGDLTLIRRYSASGDLPVTAFPDATPTQPEPDTSTDRPVGTTRERPTTAGDPQGTLSFVDNTVDTTTGTVMLKATFSNRDGTLWAGQYVPVVLRVFVEDHALVVPAPAVLTGQQGTYVYVVDSAGAAQQRPVRLERTAGSVAVIASGVADGDVVVTDGQSRLTPGVKVTTTTSDSTPPKGPAARHR
jgi:multidrug efflux system membrane fusion protein